MPYDYIDPSRETDAFSLPDVEIWEDYIYELECPRCGEFEIPGEVATATQEQYCPSCGHSDNVVAKRTKRTGWFWQYGMPGYMPDSDYPSGPYDSYEDALTEAREQAGYYGEADAEEDTD